MTRRLIRLLSLLGPAVVIAVAAAVTPLSEFSTNQGDVGYYLQRASDVADGRVPYRDVPLEYPPLALVPMLVPVLATPADERTVDQYRWRFAAWEAVLAVVLGVFLARVHTLGGSIGGRPDRATWFGVGGRLTLLSIGAALALAWRFDLLPALLVTIAVWAALAQRAAVAGAALGLGVLTKLYPVVVGPAVAAGWLLRGDGRRIAGFGVAAGVVVLVGMLPFTLLAGPSALGFLGYQNARGLQIESVGGGIAVLAGLVTGSPPELSFGFSAVEVNGSVAGAALALLPLLTVAAFGLLGWLGWRRVRAELAAAGPASRVEPATLTTLVFASLLVLLATSKVYSIQYVVWILPFVALLRGRAFWLGAAAVALTMPIHPLLYADLVRQEALPILVLNLRNALVVALTAWLLASLRPSRAALP